MKFNFGESKLGKSLFKIFVPLVLVICGCSGQSKMINSGQKAPLTRFALMDGSVHSTEEYLGKHLLLVFWATNCSKSKSTLNDVAYWQRNFGRKVGVHSVAISIDKQEAESRVQELYANPKLQYIDHAFSGNDIYDEAYIAYDVGEVPTLVLIDPKGKIIATGDSLDVLSDRFPAS